MKINLKTWSIQLKKEKIKLSGEDMREGLSCVLSVKVPDPKFSSQTKDKLVSSEVRPVVENLVNEQLGAWFEEHPSEARSIVSKVVEAAVVGRPDDLTGQAICAFVTVERAYQADAALKTELMEHVAKEIGKLARPAEIRFTDTLPKTRSGKIMRRLLRDIAAGKETTQDTTTLEDYSILAKLRSDEE